VAAVAVDCLAPVVAVALERKPQAVAMAPLAGPTLVVVVEYSRNRVLALGPAGHPRVLMVLAAVRWMVKGLPPG
jgi:hypothetical protein